VAQPVKPDVVASEPAASIFLKEIPSLHVDLCSIYEVFMTVKKKSFNTNELQITLYW